MQISISTKQKSGFMVYELDFNMSDDEQEIREAADEYGAYVDVKNVKHGPAGYLQADILFKDKAQATAWLKGYSNNDMSFVRDALKTAEKV